MVDFVEMCNVCAKKAIIKAAKRIINYDKMCRSCSDLNFRVTFWNTVNIAALSSESQVTGLTAVIQIRGLYTGNEGQGNAKIKHTTGKLNEFSLLV